MLFKILIRYILGYVNISVQGYYIERFINTCITKGIFLWNVKLEGQAYAHANVGIKEFKKLKEIARKTACRIKINDRKGMPFFMNRYRKRKIFFILLASVIVFMYVESKFIWNIEVRGLERIQEQEILEELSTLGLNLGTRKSQINTKEIINAIRLKRDDIAWMNINLNGTNIIVEIAETTKKPEIVAENEFCNIVSTKTAQIEKITATNGTAQVKVGDIVTEGSILIGGWMEGKYTGTRYVHGARRS